MAIPAILPSEQGLRLAKLLCEIAGVDSMEVRSITCRCRCNDVVTFEIEKFAHEDAVKAALDKETVK